MFLSVSLPLPKQHFMLESTACPLPNFRLLLIDPSARDIEGQQVFLALTLFRVSVGFNHYLRSSPRPPSRYFDQSPMN